MGEALEAEFFSDSAGIISVWTDKSDHLCGVLKMKQNTKNNPDDLLINFQTQSMPFGPDTKAPGIYFVSLLFLIISIQFWLAIPILMPKK